MSAMTTCGQIIRRLTIHVHEKVSVLLKRGRIAFRVIVNQSMAVQVLRESWLWYSCSYYMKINSTSKTSSACGTTCADSVS